MCVRLHGEGGGLQQPQHLSEPQEDVPDVTLAPAAPAIDVEAPMLLFLLCCNAILVVLPSLSSELFLTLHTALSIEIQLKFKS